MMRGDRLTFETDAGEGRERNMGTDEFQRLKVLREKEEMIFS
jgi:hypothetical protein